MRSLTIALLLWLTAAPTIPARQADTAPAASCGPVGAAYMRTTLYFGLTRKTGNITGAQWKDFLRGEVTPRFPQGLTVWEAGGQWRRADGTIVRERSKVLLLVHDDSAPVREAVISIIEAYKQRFEQESVLWETARVCAAF